MTDQIVSEPLDLDAEDIFARIEAADDLRREKVFVPEWKVDVYVRALKSREWDHIQKIIATEKGEKADKSGKKSPNAAALAVSLAVTDNRNRRIFDSPQKARVIDNKNLGVVARLATRINELTEMNDEAVEAEAKNFESSTGEDS